MNSLKEIEYIREESRAKNLKKKTNKNLNVIDVMNNTYHYDDKQYKCNKWKLKRKLKRKHSRS